MNHGPVELVRLITTGTDPGDLIRLLYTRQWWARIWKRFWRASMRTTLRWAVRASSSLSKSTVVRLSRRTLRLCGTASGFLISLSIQKIRRFSSWGCLPNTLSFRLRQQNRAQAMSICLFLSVFVSICLSVYLSQSQNLSLISLLSVSLLVSFFSNCSSLKLFLFLLHSLIPCFFWFSLYLETRFCARTHALFVYWVVRVMIF